ncbi:hypothetical protein [Micromonospora sp. NPDC049679]|uniref:hypothetical protein n=1 Tax=Micromonospora sp. NPDC049679 TaxID=3155920 RepID=UPI003401CC2E
MSEAYGELLRRLAELTTRLDERRAEAQQWYAERCAAADEAVVAADAAVLAARDGLDSLRGEVDDVDREAAALWAALADRLGPVAARFGGPPGPSTDPAEAGDDPERWLAGARELLDRSRDVGPVPRSAYPLLVIFGVLGALAAAGLAAAARVAGTRYGGDLAVGMPVLALLVTLLGPFVGLAPAKVLTDRRHASLDPRSAAVVIIAGLAMTALAFAALR